MNFFEAIANLPAPVAEPAGDAQWTQRDVVGFVSVYGEAKEAVAKGEQVKASTGRAIKQYFALHPEEKILRDGETGWEADVGRSHAPDRYDTVAMPQDLILELWRRGALDINADVIKAAEGRDRLTLRVKPFKIPGGEIAVLRVKQRAAVLP